MTNQKIIFTAYYKINTIQILIHKYLTKINSYLLWNSIPTRWSWNRRKLNIKAVQSQGRLQFQMEKVPKILTQWINSKKAFTLNSKSKTHKKSIPGAQPKTTCTMVKIFKKDQILMIILQMEDKLESSN